MGRYWIVCLWFAGCVQSNSVECEHDADRWSCPAGSLCDPARVGCVQQDQLASCVGQADGTACTVAPDNSGVCITEVCERSECGDGFVIAPEQCDGAALGATPSCQEKRFYDDIPAGCRADCTYDYSACTGFCGDNVTNGPEICDGSPPQTSCADLGYGGGFLECTPGCGPYLDGCEEIGWTSHLAPIQMVDVDGVSDKDVFALGTGFNAAAVTHFDGTTWADIDVSSCAVSGKNLYLVGLQAIGNGKALLAAGDADMNTPNTDAVIIAVDGSTCTRMPVAANGKSLHDVWQISPTNIWAVGNGIFHFDGSSWTSSNTNTLFTSVWAAAANDVYAGGYAGLWHFNGTDWSSVPIASTEVYSIAGVSGTNVYVAGDAGIEHWNGATWEPAFAGPPSGLIAIASDGVHLFAAAYDDAYVLDGTIWSSLTRPDAFDPAVYAIWASPSGTVFTTAGRRVERYAGGALLARSIIGSGMALAVTDANTAYALTTDNFYIYDGKQWTADADPGFGVNYEFSSYIDIYRSPTDKIYFVQFATTSGALVRRTPGAPPTWDIIAGGIDSSFEMAGTSDDDIWMTSYYGQRLLHWNGTDLDQLCATCEFLGDNYMQLWGSSPTNYFAVGMGGKILHWNGAAWSLMTTNTTNTITTVFGFAANDVYAAGDGVFLHYDGNAWSELPAPPNTPLTNTLWGTAGNDLFVSTSQGVVHYDGKHWAPVRIGTDTRIDVLSGAGTATFMLDAGTQRTPNVGTALRLVRTNDWSVP